MPCWSVQENDISMIGMTGERLEILRAALKQLGYHIYRPGYKGFETAELVADHFGQHTSVVVEKGVVTVKRAGGESMALAEAEKQVRKAYSFQVVQAALKKFGWQQTPQQMTQGGKIRATRRY